MSTHDEMLTALKAVMTDHGKTVVATRLTRAASGDPAFSLEIIFANPRPRVGWYNGEWTCPICSTMLGKNLNGAPPWGLVAAHQNECTVSNPLTPVPVTTVAGDALE